MFGGLVALCVCGILAPQASPKHVMLEPRALPSSIGMFLYCFSGLPCLPNIRSSMQNTSNYSHAVHLAFIFATIYYTVVGLAGYHFYAEGTRESFTENLMPAFPAPRLDIWLRLAVCRALCHKTPGWVPALCSPRLASIWLRFRSRALQPGTQGGLHRSCLVCSSECGLRSDGAGCT